MKLTIVINIRHPEWEGARIDQMAVRWELDGLVRRVRRDSYVVTVQGIDAGMVEALNEYRLRCARYQAARAKLEALKAEYEKEYGPLPKEGTTDDRLPTDQVPRDSREKGDEHRKRPDMT